MNGFPADALECLHDISSSRRWRMSCRKKETGSWDILSLKQLREDMARAFFNSSAIIHQVSISCIRKIVELKIFAVFKSNQYIVNCIINFDAFIGRDHKTIGSAQINKHNISVL